MTSPETRPRAAKLATRLLLAGLPVVGLVLASSVPPIRSARAATLTAKERLSDKASDQQRVDDCKVPPAKRTRARPTACPWDAGV